jgi:hypothetical protein
MGMGVLELLVELLRLDVVGWLVRVERLLLMWWRMMRMLVVGLCMVVVIVSHLLRWAGGWCDESWVGL